MDISDLAKEYSTEAAILKNAAKLTGKWENVYRHCLTVGLVTDVIRQSCKLPRLVTIAGILHDAEKRLEYSAQDFTPEEVIILNNILSIAVPQELRRATLPLREENLSERKDLASKILAVADWWTSEDKIVGVEKRIEESSFRWPDLDPNLQIKTCHQFERDICASLPQNLKVENLFKWTISELNK